MGTNQIPLEFHNIKVTPESEIDVKNFNLETKHHIYFKDATKLRENMDDSVHLVVTSPPYWQIKDYGNKNQIGYGNSLEEYFDKLNEVWGECIRLLNPGCKFCINIGDQFLRAIKNKRAYQIIPLHAYMINHILNKFKNEVVYLGSINWNKISTSNTSGGGKIMGSIYYPRNGYFFINREYIIVLRKRGADPKPKPEIKDLSYISLHEWRRFFKDYGIFQELIKEHMMLCFLKNYRTA